MAGYQDFKAALLKRKLDEALALLQNADAGGQRAILAGMAEDLAFQSCAANVRPTRMAILWRTLKEGRAFSDFYAAWQPPVPSPGKIAHQNAFAYFGEPVRVINGQSTANPRELVSIGLIAATSDTALDADLKARQETEAARAASIARVADKTHENGTYVVVSDDVLGGVGQPPAM